MKIDDAAAIYAPSLFLPTLLRIAGVVENHTGTSRHQKRTDTVEPRERDPR